MEILDIKCPGCGEKGKLRRYKYLDGRGTDASFKLVPKDEPYEEGYTRLVCTNCCLTFGYWFGVKTLVSIEEKYERKLQLIKECEEKTKDYLKNAYLNVFNLVLDKIDTVSLNKHRNELLELKQESLDENITVKRLNELKELIAVKENEIKELEEKEKDYNEFVAKRDSLGSRFKFKIEISDKEPYPYIKSRYYINKDGVFSGKFYQSAMKEFDESIIKYDEYIPNIVIKYNEFIKKRTPEVRYFLNNRELNVEYTDDEFILYCSLLSYNYIDSEISELKDANRLAENIKNRFGIDVKDEMTKIVEEIFATPYPKYKL